MAWTTATCNKLWAIRIVISYVTCAIVRAWISRCMLVSTCYTVTSSTISAYKTVLVAIQTIAIISSCFWAVTGISKGAVTCGSITFTRFYIISPSVNLVVKVEIRYKPFKTAMTNFSVSCSRYWRVWKIILYVLISNSKHIYIYYIPAANWTSWDC